ncbi:uncharacterized protein LOC134261253 [Saccostrea cucullata]|uniref:uncharacterized protein LOC134261253 n=1 Tax=Saccostrea cuccullata TaxID=36930 RepID=UPI002ED01B9B
MIGRSGLSRILVWYFVVEGLVVVFGLECWKCIQKDCHKDPNYNQRAEKITCQTGEHCLKVRYQMFHNDSHTHYDSVIRTCSPYKCPYVTEDDYEQCLGNMRKYMFQGCSLRSCCNDRDLCNVGSVPSSVCFLTMILLLFMQWL